MVGELGLWYPAHGLLMIGGGVLFGVAVVRAGVPRWTGVLLVLGVSLNLLFGLVRLPDAGQLAPSLLRNLAFIGMGAAVLRRSA